MRAPWRIIPFALLGGIQASGQTTAGDASYLTENRPFKERLAYEWIANEEPDERDAVTASEEGVQDAIIAEAKSLTVRMRAIAKEGVNPGSKRFWRELSRGAAKEAPGVAERERRSGGIESQTGDRKSATAERHGIDVAKVTKERDTAYVDLLKLKSGTDDYLKAWRVVENKRVTLDAINKEDSYEAARAARSVAEKALAAAEGGKKSEVEAIFDGAKAKEMAAFEDFRPYQGVLGVDEADRLVYLTHARLGDEARSAILIEEPAARMPSEPNKETAEQRSKREDAERRKSGAQDKLDLAVAEQKALRAKHAREANQGVDLISQDARITAEASERSANRTKNILKNAENDPKRTPFAFTHAGLHMLSPYSIRDMESGPLDAKRKMLSPDGDTKVGGFFEFVYTNIWAWRPSRQTLSFPSGWAEDTKFQYLTAGALPYYSFKDGRWGFGSRNRRLRNWLSNSWDLTSRVSFQFGRDDQPSAAAITGSGDFNAEVTLDKHLVRGVADDGQTAFNGNLGISIAGATDKSAFKVHPRILVGPSVALSFADPFSSGPNPRSVWFRMHGGRAYVDALSFTNPDVSSEIDLTLGGSPRYKHEWAYAFESELYWPLREYALLSMSTRFYGHIRPAPWSISLGLTFPIATIADSLSPK